VLKVKKPRAISALALISVILITVPILSVKGWAWPLVWEGDVSSTGVPVISPVVLEAGREYRIEVQGSFIASMYGVAYFAIDAQYYTPDPSDDWIWDPLNTFPAPGGHSFLQINGMDVNWGPFSNGEPPAGVGPVGHEYSTYYTGTGAPITFAIVDWTEPYWPTDVPPLNHWCHIHVWIYEGPKPPRGETAFAYGGPEYATCFLSMDFDGDGKRDFNSWGWSNGLLGAGSYNFDIWAGAAKCNLNKGELVGTLTIDYDGSTAIVTYTMDAGWIMQNTQLYVGSEPLPRDNQGEYTVAPGQYPYIHAGISAVSDTYTVSGLSGNIYVVAHADVLET